MEPRLPAGHLDRPKSGFGLPVHRWLKRHPGFIQAAVRRLRERGVLQRAVNREFRRAWYLLVLDRWFTAFELTLHRASCSYRFRDPTAWANTRAARRLPAPCRLAGRGGRAFPAEPCGPVRGERAVPDDVAGVVGHLSIGGGRRVLENWRPQVVVFDNAGRTAQLRAAQRLGARIVFISARRRQRRKAFRLRWMRLLDEHWIAYPEFIAGSSPRSNASSCARWAARRCVTSTSSARGRLRSSVRC